MAIFFANGNDSTKISAPPRVVFTYDTGRTGCPPTAAASAAWCSITVTINNPAAIYITGKNIRYWNGRTDLYLYATGPNGWSSTALRVRLNWTNGLNWETTMIRHTMFLSTIGTYTFWLAGAGANAWGCPDDGPARYGYLGALIMEC